MDNRTQASEPIHSLGVVCRRTGLKPDRLRAWERRYDVVRPQRSGGNQRLYSEADIERLTLLRQATDVGHRIAHISDLSTAELRDLVAEILPAAPQPLRPATPTEMDLAESFLSVALAAIQQLDTRWLKSALEQAAKELPAPVFIQELLVPLLHRIGDLWEEGGLHPAHEHASTAVIRAFLDDMRSSYEPAPEAPGLVMATLANELHELGALLATALASGDGWDVTYLGPSLPAEDIALVARQKRARAVGLSLVYRSNQTDVDEELRKLRRHVGPGTALVVGGHGSEAVGDTLEEIGAIRVDDLHELRQALAAIWPRDPASADGVFH